ncbi:MAG: translocation/assembly module TamB domain-containing protein [Cardiobacteriaceae bacterium]|nr:translocation/assembly module TamB domain-containing protein [Cardiobacteriaceae bacterium]
MTYFFHMLWRLCKWMIGALFILLAVIIAGIYFLLGTESGYRQVPQLVNRFTPITLEYDHLQGKLLGSQRWENLHIRDGNGLDIRLGQAEMDFNWQDLFSKRVHIRAVAIKEAKIALPAGTKEESKSSEPLQSLPQIRLPIDIVLDEAILENVSVQQTDTEITRIDHARLSASYQEGDHLRLDLQTRMSQFDGNIQGEVRTTADYPLALQGAGTLFLPGEPESDVRLNLSGSVLKPVLRLQSSGGIELDADLRGEVDLGQQMLDLRGNWQRFAYGDQVQSTNGQLALKGPFDALQLQFSGDVNGKDIPPASVDLSARIGGEKLEDIDLILKALGGELALQGQVALGETLAWDARLRVKDVDGKRFRDDLALQLDADIDTQGTLQGDALKAQLKIGRLAGNWQEHPIVGHGSMAIDGQQITVDDLLLELAGNRLQANGQAGADNADLQVRLDADNIERLLPGIRGKIQAQGHVRGDVTDPQLDIAAKWQDLQVLDDSKAAIVDSAAGSLHLNGRWQAFDVFVDGKAKGRDFPPLQAKGKSRVLFSQGTGKATDIDLDVHTLNGLLKATGEVSFLPQLDWDIRAEAKGIEPQGYMDNLQGKVDAVILSKGRLADGKLEMDNKLENLAGQWQGQKLDGKGNVSMEGDKLLLDGVALDVGGNRVDVDGHIQGDVLDIRFALDGKNLAGFHPDLRGTLSGKGEIQGKVSAPQVKTELNGSNLAFADYQLASLDAKLDSSLQKGGAFNNRIVLGKLRAAGQEWAEVQVETVGRFEAHTLRVQSKGGTFDIDLAAEGGLESLDAWRGTLQRLQARGHNLEWALQKPAALAVSPQAVNLKDFCLADKYSALCLTLQHEKGTLLTYDISKIDPRSFAAFIPDTVTLETALAGKGQVRIDAAGKMLGDANIRLTPGRIVVRPPRQAPISLTLREGVLESAFTGNEARSRLNLDFAESGTVQGTLVVRDYNALNLDGQAQVNIPDLGRFAYLVPKVSEMKGKVQGTLHLGGNAAKPVVSGQIVMDGGVVKIPEYATDLRDIRLELKAERSGKIDINGKIGTPEGHLDANGILHLSPLKMSMNLAGERMLIADSKTMRVLVSPKFDINIDPDDGIIVKGQVEVPEARIDIPDTSGGESISEDVIIVNGKEKGVQDVVAAPSSAPMRVDIAVRLGDKVYFANKDVKLRLIGGIDIGIRPGRPVSARGTIEVASGYYELYGQELNIRRGRVTFSGGNIANPAVEVLALREVGDVDVGARVSGTVQNLRLDLTSEPAMPDSAILSYLLFGRAPDGAMDSESLMQTAASIGFKGVFPDDLAEKTGLDVFDLGVTGLKAGKYLSEDIYVGMRSNFFTGLTEFLARYQFNRRMSMEVTSSGDNTAVDFLYQFEKD